MVLKRELSQASAGSPPARKAPRLTLAVLAPSSPDPLSTAPTTVVSPTVEDRVPSPPFPAAFYPLPRTAFGVHLDPAQLVARLEELAEEYERSVDEMGAEIEQLRRQVRQTQRALDGTPSLEDCSGPSLIKPLFAGTQPAGGIQFPNLDSEVDAPVSTTTMNLKAETVLQDVGEGDGVEGDGVEDDGVEGDGVEDDGAGENEGVAGSQTA